MDSIQVRTLQIIEYLASTQDEQLLSQIEIIMKEVKIKSMTSRLTEKDLEKRVEKSMNDIRLGKVYTQEELEFKSQSW
jgi:hypothetical protein